MATVRRELQTVLPSGREKRNCAARKVWKLRFTIGLLLKRRSFITRKYEACYHSRQFNRSRH
jgi:hypothetical protein